MLKHYLKIAFRNSRKYKSQTLISIIGLAVGFACFALAALWIRYEMTYDSFHREAERIFCVRTPAWWLPGGGNARGGSALMAGHLKNTFPEISEATLVIPAYSTDNVEIEDKFYDVKIAKADTGFLRFFDIRIVEGNPDFTVRGNKNMAITQEKARQLFGNESPLGKTVKYWYQEYTICAVVSGFTKQSNYAFEFIEPMDNYKMAWGISYGEHTLIRLAPEVDEKAFAEKLAQLEIKDSYSIKNIDMVPLTELRYSDDLHIQQQREVKFQHILIFALSGSLLILCTLFNYLTLFVSRLRSRLKELALRKICGASEGSLFTMLSVEFCLSLTCSLVAGLLLIRLLHRPFTKLAEAQLDLSAVCLEAALYIVALILLCLPVFRLILRIFRRRSLNLAIRRGNRNMFRKISIVVQLFISIGFAFCTIVILKQMYYLHTTDLGFSFKDRGSVTANNNPETLENRIRQLPEILETVPSMQPLVPMSYRTGDDFDWEGKPEDAAKVKIEEYAVSEKIISLYELRLLEGELLKDSDPEDLILINETVAKTLGWDKSVGKKLIFSADRQYTVKGVIKDIYQFAPTVKPKAFFYRLKTDRINHILFRCKEGSMKICQKKINEIGKELFPEINYFETLDTEEEYDKFLKSENALLKILNFVSLVCVLICVFGFVSLVSLTCEERRKEIAIRKINGATAGNILMIFIREYSLLLLVGAAIAFPVAVYIMVGWLEQYVKQTALSAWIYLSIMFALALVIVLCVGWRVFLASVKNPAEEVKS